LSILFDELFRIPLIGGALLAVSLPLLGAYLRMRSEWLAALGLSNMAAAGAALAVVLHLPVLLVSFVVVAICSGLKLVLIHTGSKRRGNDYYAFLIIFGWSLLILFSSLGHDALVLAQSLVDGQLFFIDSSKLILTLSFVVLLIVILPLISRKLLIERFFLDYFSANLASPWPHRILFELLVIIAVVISTTSIGVMSTFALMFIPPLIAFTFINGWKVAILLSSIIGLVSYLGSFVLALTLDLPFGPTQVIVLSLALGGFFVIKKL